MRTDPPPPEDHGPDRGDALLAEGLRRLENGDSTGWRDLLREHDGEAAALAARARRLQLHGFYSNALLSARLGPFAIGEKLGGGGMGLVYRARRDGAADDCALKIVRPELLDSEHGGVRFVREVETARALAHPGIVRILDCDLTANPPWFAMERIDGPSLAELIRRARQHGPAVAAAPWCERTAAVPELPLWCRTVLGLLAQVLDALAHAHARGITHRDVKPSNILVAADGRAVLIDFGLAHVDANTTITRTRDTLGSLPYLPPEVLRGDGSSSPGADIYAAGATLYHALALQPPFAAVNAEGLRANILHAAPAPLRRFDPTLPPALEAVWQRAMAPEPNRRYADAAAFAADLRAILAGQRPAARPPGPWLRAHRLARRHPARALAVAIALLFFAVLPTATYWVGRNELWRTLRSSDLHEIECWVFDDADQQRTHRTLAELDQALDALTALRDRMAQRRDQIAAMQQASVVAAAARWRSTIDAIADRAQNPAYRGLRIAPQFGLVPIGRDAASGLFEFAHLPSGAPAVRGPDGRLSIDETTGIVLVLLPGGRVRVGADRDPASPHFDADAEPGEGPSQLVRLDPFFLSKYEVTQAQWVRQRGHNNCTWKPDLVPAPGLPALTACHPVDHVTIHEARRIATQWGLLLPTGAQWEYAARGGSPQRRWCGDDPAALARCAQLRDVTYDRSLPLSPPTPAADLQPADPWPLHAPVGSLQANPFGLHDVFGNAWEWCRDAALEGPLDVADGDGSTGTLDLGSLRGSGCSVLWTACRVTARLKPLPDSNAGGLRPLRPIEGEYAQDPQ